MEAENLQSTVRKMKYLLITVGNQTYVALTIYTKCQYIYRNKNINLHSVCFYYNHCSETKIKMRANWFNLQSKQLNLDHLMRMTVINTLWIQLCLPSSIADRRCSNSYAINLSLTKTVDKPPTIIDFFQCMSRCIWAYWYSIPTAGSQTLLNRTPFRAYSFRQT